jgi:tRNA (cytidine32/uridine32-2'-O)-methyltransferase
MLQNIRIVLVNPSHPGNIGAAARAMKTMCLHRLVLVQPERYPDAEATARASGADDVLAAAVVVDTLPAAISDCSLVYGASARQRTLAWPEVTPAECARQVVAQPAHTEIAIVFGRERTGLDNDELGMCNRLVHIPGNEVYSSLNLAAAVQVIAYELLQATFTTREASVNTADQDEPASADDLQRFYEHLETALIDIDFLDPGNPRLLMRRLRRLFNRAGLDRTEVNILRGILTAAQKNRP